VKELPSSEQRRDNTIGAPSENQTSGEVGVSWAAKTKVYLEQQEHHCLGVELPLAAGSRQAPER